MADASPMLSGTRSEPASWTIASSVAAAARRFRKAGLASPQRDARLLAAAACGFSVEQTIADRERVLRPDEFRRLEAMTARRLTGEPASRIIGQREFWGLPFKIMPAVLDPRPETELLVEIALQYVRRRGRSDDCLRVLDLGTGSGCLLAALLTELPHATGLGVDKSLNALRVAQENLASLGLLNRATILCASWGWSLALQTFDIVVCNPPYIASDCIPDLEPEVRLFDPATALDGGQDGYSAFDTIVPNILQLLRGNGLAVCETGYDQASEVAHRFRRSLADEPVEVSVWVEKDLAGHERAVAVERHR